MTDKNKGKSEAILRKKTADKRWNHIYSILMSGENVDQGVIGRCMMECNDADTMCMKFGFKIRELND